jgi:AcrR family transcriptional regulator
MGRPRTVSDEAILEAARAVFLEQGPSASTQSIADRISLSQAALFKRFGTKQDLMIAALMPPAIPPFVAVVAAGPSLEEPLELQLRSIGRDLILFFRGMVPCLMVLKTAGIDLQKLLERFPEPPPVLMRRSLAEWFDRAMDAGLARRGDPLALASSFLGAFHMHSFMSHITDQVMEDDELLAFSDAVVDVLWWGIDPRETS